MSNLVKGTIAAVSCKESTGGNPKFGKSYQTRVCVDEVWYGGFTKKSADELGLVKGRLVTFSWTQNGDYKNFDPKSLSVSETVAAAPAPAAPVASGAPNAAASSAPKVWAGEKGVKIGHAVTNAVQLAIAAKELDTKSIYKYAVGILRLSKKLEADYDGILNPPTEPAVAVQPAPAPEPKQETPPAPKGKPGRKPKAVAPEPEPEEEEPVAKAPAAKAAVTEPDGFDDDIPF